MKIVFRKHMIAMIMTIVIVVSTISCSKSINKNVNYYENEKYMVYTTSKWNSRKIPALNAINTEIYDIDNLKSCESTSKKSKKKSKTNNKNKSKRDNIENEMILDWFGKDIELQYNGQSSTTSGTIYTYKIKNEFESFFDFAEIDGEKKVISFEYSSNQVTAERYWNVELSLEDNTLEFAKQILMTYGENIDDYEKNFYTIDYYSDANDNYCLLELFDNSYYSTLVFDITVKQDQSIVSFQYHLTDRYLKKFNNLIVDDEKVTEEIKDFISTAFKQADVKLLRYDIEKSGIEIMENGDVILETAINFYKDDSTETGNYDYTKPIVVVIGSIK